MPALLIKDLPPELHERLKDSATRHRRSLTKEALVLLETALATPDRPVEPPRPFKARLPLTQELLDQAKGEGRE
jgi:plasmid stability protein